MRFVSADSTSGHGQLSTVVDGTAMHPGIVIGNGTGGNREGSFTVDTGSVIMLRFCKPASCRPWRIGQIPTFSSCDGSALDVGGTQVQDRSTVGVGQGCSGLQIED